MEFMLWSLQRIGAESGSTEGIAGAHIWPPTTIDGVVMRIIGIASSVWASEVSIGAMGCSLHRCGAVYGVTEGRIGVGMGSPTTINGRVMRIMGAAWKEVPVEASAASLAAAFAFFLARSSPSGQRWQCWHAEPRLPKPSAWTALPGAVQFGALARLHRRPLLPHMVGMRGEERRPVALPLIRDLHRAVVLLHAGFQQRAQLKGGAEGPGVAGATIGAGMNAEPCCCCVAGAFCFRRFLMAPLGHKWQRSHARPFLQPSASSTKRMASKRRRCEA
eukprot:CAMPEP_0176155406 /NCGR_PEP_ID=MMETSP0120_2-20121206/79415_1 /TAXON_ID=160619 /ORGANISM="Kryptoperidinium foliaceum, Strain CCMP 1326" /LENGTH=274 /DNA_ID=CAMNT_0017492563 /DNA_START=463 /DNA_END=1285 /DNA_ORIENTATION=-